MGLGFSVERIMAGDLAVEMGRETVAESPWDAFIPAEQWVVYSAVLHRARAQGIEFVVGGGLAFSHYSGRWRNTKDIDLYVTPGNRDRMIKVAEATGLKDYFDVHDYDRAWIFRSHNGAGVIVDIIWQMANYRAQVTQEWLTRGEVVRVHGMELRMLPVEELLWAKLYVMQRDRCDWGDLLNILFSRGRSMDWDHLLECVGEDWRVVAGLVEIFAWACPGRAAELPGDLWGKLRIDKPRQRERGAVDGGHIRLLDSRDWFGPNGALAENGGTR